MIDEDLWKRVKFATINRGITMTKFVDIALNKALEDNDDDDDDLLSRISSAKEASGSVFEPYKKPKST